MKRITLLVFFYGISILMVFAQYQWINPLPQGNELNAICMTNDNIGFAAGDYGTILKTTDGGNTWTLLGSPTNQNLLDICFLNDSRGFICGDSGSILMTENAGIDWLILNASTDEKLVSLCSTNDSTILIAGREGEFYRSTDAGSSWSNFNIDKDMFVEEIAFPFDSMGFAVGYSSNTYNGIVYKTTDAGKYWSLMTDSLPEPLLCVDFQTAELGYAAGNYSLIYKTGNGGTDWTELPNPHSGTSHDIHDIIFLDDQTGFTAGRNGVMMKTTDGQTWTEMTSDSEMPLNAIFGSDNLLLSVGTGGLMLRSENQQDFLPVSEGFSDHLVKLFNPAQDIFYAIGDACMIKSEDNGESWNYKYVPELEYCQDGDFVNSQTGFALCSGNIYRTEDSGNTWTQVYKSGKYDFMNSIVMLNENLGYAFGGGISPGGATWSTLLRTTNGINWNSINSPSGKPLLDGYFIDENTGFITGWAGGVFKTTDGGNTWEDVSTPYNYYFNAIHFVNENTGIICGHNNWDGSIVMRSTDAGETWYPVFQNNGEIGRYLNSPVFYDENTGYITGSFGYILKTTDGGATWEEQSSFTNSSTSSIALINAESGFVAGAYGMLASFGLNTGTYGYQEESASHSIRIWPNPFKQQFSIEVHSQNTGNVVVEIYTAKGNLLNRRKISNTGPVIKVCPSIEQNGIYLIRISTGEATFVKKIIKN